MTADRLAHTGFTARQAEERYPPPDTKTAIAYAEEMIEEWDYDQDPHGYCHTRAMLIALVQALASAEANLARVQRHLQHAVSQRGGQA